MLRHFTIVSMLMVLLAGPASASEGDAVKGLVADKCSDCHVVRGYEDRAADVGAPAFADIVADSDTYSEERVRAYLQSPRWQMRQFNLSPKEIDRIVAYFQEQRAAQ